MEGIEQERLLGFARGQSRERADEEVRLALDRNAAYGLEAELPGRRVAQVNEERIKVKLLGDFEKDLADRFAWLLGFEEVGEGPGKKFVAAVLTGKGFGLGFTLGNVFDDEDDAAHFAAVKQRGDTGGLKHHADPGRAERG